MRPIGGWENRTHCKWGHEYTPENTRTEPNRGHRVCRACVRARRDKYLGRLATELRQRKAFARAANLSGAKKVDLRTRDRSKLRVPRPVPEKLGESEGASASFPRTALSGRELEEQIHIDPTSRESRQGEKQGS